MISTLCQVPSVREVSTLCCDVHAHIHEPDHVYKKSHYTYIWPNFHLFLFDTEHNILIYSCMLEKLTFGIRQSSMHTDITLEDNHC